MIERKRLWVIRGSRVTKKRKVELFKDSETFQVCAFSSREAARRAVAEMRRVGDNEASEPLRVRRAVLELNEKAANR